MRHQRQRGAVLVLSLLLLTVMTLLVLSAINTGTTNMRILENTRATQEAESALRQEAADVMSDADNFYLPLPDESTHDTGDYTVTVTEPECIATRPADGYSAKWEHSPEDTTWEFRVTLDHDNGATTVVDHGVEIRMPANNCPSASAS